MNSRLDWRPSSLDVRLSDWRGAGYKGGQPIPTVSGSRVKYYGPGTHILSTLDLVSGDVLRGAGEGQTTCLLPKPMEYYFGAGRTGANSQYTSSGGLIVARGTEIGIEDMTLEGPARRMAEHHEEPGYNAVDWRVVDGWVRRVRLSNFDSALLARFSERCTFEDVTVDNLGMTKNSSGSYAHYAILLGRECARMLVTRPHLRRRIHHCVTVQYNSRYNVVMDGEGDLVNFDHHRGNPHHNLFTNFVVGPGTDWLRSGGNPASVDGQRNGPGETFWGIRKNTGGSVSVLPVFSATEWDRRVVIVGHTQNRLNSDPNKEWVEALSPVDPHNLYLAQRGEEVPPPSGFVVGARVRATDALKMRSGPAKTASLLGEQPEGAQATLMQGPTFDAASGFTYWRLDCDEGIDGWGGQDRLMVI